MAQDVAQVDERQSGLFADLPGPLQGVHRRGRGGEAIGWVVAADVPRDVRPQLGDDAPGDALQHLILVVHAWDDQSSDLQVQAQFTRQAAVAPYFLHVDPLAVSLHGLGIALHVHVHGVQPSFHEQP